MKQLTVFIFLMSIALSGLSQTDTVRNAKQFKEAPESLKKLIEGITAKTYEVKKDADIEIDGLLFDETKTKSGKDFYDYFYSQWVAPLNAKNYSIFIKEGPYRLTTTLIVVKINETTVFQSYIQPRGDFVELIAQQAVARTQLYLQNYEEILRQLDGDDRSGSGIF